MKPQPSHLAFAALAAAAAIWGALQLFGGEEGRIRARLGELEGLLDKAAGESALVGGARTQKLGSLL